MRPILYPDLGDRSPWWSGCDEYVFACAACTFSYRSEISSNGTFTSPNYPGFYPCNTECHYLFHGRPNERIFISFPYFDVEGIWPG